MSHKVVTLVYSRSVGSAHRKAILAYMAERASDNGEGVFCSKGTIANETEIARSTVFKTIKDLVAEGVLIEMGHRSCRNGATVVYDLDLDAIRAFPEIAKEPAEKRVPQAPTSPSAGPVRDVTSPSAGPYQSAERTPTSPSAGPKPSLEPSLNPDAIASVTTTARSKGPPTKRIPSDWTPSPASIDYARGKGIPEEIIHEEARGFHAYWSDRSDRDARKSDRGWEQCWEGWCRRIATRYAGSRPAPSRSFDSRDRQPDGILGAVLRGRSARAN